MGSEVIFVLGTPVPQGSKRGIIHRTTKRVVLIESGGSRLKAWREQIRGQARLHFGLPKAGPISMTLQFSFRRPANQMKGGVLKESAPAEHLVRPDLDKLVRAVLDGLTGVAFDDDSQVTHMVAFKRYAHPEVDEYEGVVIGVYWND